MTTNPRFLALVAKVDEWNQTHIFEEHDFDTEGKICNEIRTNRALKGEIMRHEPLERNAWAGLDHEPEIYFICRSCNDGDGLAQDWPCKPFLDMEGEVGK